jgi:hypothetical protein
MGDLGMFVFVLVAPHRRSSVLVLENHFDPSFDWGQGDLVTWLGSKLGWSRSLSEEFLTTNCKSVRSWLKVACWRRAASRTVAPIISAGLVDTETTMPVRQRSLVSSMKVKNSNYTKFIIFIANFITHLNPHCRYYYSLNNPQHTCLHPPEDHGKPSFLEWTTKSSPIESIPPKSQKCNSYYLPGLASLQENKRTPS